MLPPSPAWSVGDHPAMPITCDSHSLERSGARSATSGSCRSVLRTTDRSTPLAMCGIDPIAHAERLWRERGG